MGMLAITRVWRAYLHAYSAYHIHRAPVAWLVLILICTIVDALAHVRPCTTRIPALADASHVCHPVRHVLPTMAHSA